MAKAISRPGMKGMACRDSIQRCCKEPEIYLAVRYHSMPQLQKNLVDPPPTQKGLFQPELAKELQQKFDAGVDSTPTLWVAKNFLKYVCLVLLFPFYFAFCLAPRWFSTEVAPALFYFLKKFSQPVIRAVLLAAAPVLRVCRIIGAQIQAVVLRFVKAISAVKAAILSFLLPLVAAVKKPLQFAAEWLSKSSAMAFYPLKKGFSLFGRSLLWFKIMSAYAIRQMYDFGENLLNRLKFFSKEKPLTDSPTSEILASEQPNIVAELDKGEGVPPNADPKATEHDIDTEEDSLNANGSSRNEQIENVISENELDDLWEQKF